MTMQDAFDEPLRACDFCDRAEVDDILDGIATDLVAITVRSDGLWMCATCKREQVAQVEPRVIKRLNNKPNLTREVCHVLKRLRNEAFAVSILK